MNLFREQQVRLLPVRLLPFRIRRAFWHNLGRCYHSQCGHARLPGPEWYCPACFTAARALVSDILSP